MKLLLARLTNLFSHHILQSGIMGILRKKKTKRKHRRLSSMAETASQSVTPEEEHFSDADETPETDNAESGNVNQEASGQAQEPGESRPSDFNGNNESITESFKPQEPKDDKSGEVNNPEAISGDKKSQDSGTSSPSVDYRNTKSMTGSPGSGELDPKGDKVDEINVGKKSRESNEPSLGDANGNDKVQTKNSETEPKGKSKTGNDSKLRSLSKKPTFKSSLCSEEFGVNVPDNLKTRAWTGNTRNRLFGHQDKKEAKNWENIKATPMLIPGVTVTFYAALTVEHDKQLDEKKAKIGIMGGWPNSNWQNIVVSMNKLSEINGFAIYKGHMELPMNTDHDVPFKYVHYKSNGHICFEYERLKGPYFEDLNRCLNLNGVTGRSLQVDGLISFKELVPQDSQLAPMKCIVETIMSSFSEDEVDMKYVHQVISLVKHIEKKTYYISTRGSSRCIHSHQVAR